MLGLGPNPGLLRLWHWQSHSARPHPHLGLISSTTRLDLIHTRLDLIHSRLDLIHTRLDLIHTRLDRIHTRLDLIHTRLDLIHTRLDLIHTGINLIHNSDRPHPLSARSHPLSARSHPHAVRSYPHSARSLPFKHMVRIWHVHRTYEAETVFKEIRGLWGSILELTITSLYLILDSETSFPSQYTPIGWAHLYLSANFHNRFFYVTRKWESTEKGEGRGGEGVDFMS